MYRPETAVASLLNLRAQFIHEKYVEPGSSMPLYWALLEMTSSHAVTLTDLTLTANQGPL